MNLNFSRIAIDTETTGLYSEDSIFLILIATPEQEYSVYSEEFIPSLITTLNGYTGTIVMQNAKFDLHKFAKLGVTFPSAKIVDLQILARLEDNTRFSLKLDALAKVIGERKCDEVKKYISKHKLWSMRTLPGIDKTEKHLHYDRVPREVMTPYGIQDARLPLKLAGHFIANIEDQQQRVLDNEIAMTRVLFDMEQRGILINTNFVWSAIAQMKAQIEKAKIEYSRLTSEEFVDSAHKFKGHFLAKGVELEYTEKGNPSFTGKVLKKLQDPLANCVRDLRDMKKRLTAFEGLIFYQDSNGIIHPDIKQVGAKTGRMSVANPAVQCMEKVEDPTPEDILIRRAFIPRPDHLYFMLDYDQFEYRMMLNYARQMDLIDQVKQGVDVHLATANLLGIARKQAKTINFGLLYGIGVDELGNMLGVPAHEARELKRMYFAKLPQVASFIKRVMDKAKLGMVHNWAGRQYQFNPDTCYKAPNYIIQGGCADYIKIAMLNIASFLKHKQSAMLMQIHDELLFEIHKDELDIVPHLQKLMTTVTTEIPHNILPYTCGIDYSFTSWQDKVAWP